jgi:hypothetical protein
MAQPRNRKGVSRLLGDHFTDGYDAGVKAERKANCERAAPLLEAVNDAVIMFENIERNREMPPFAQTQQQYVALGKELRRLMVLYKLVSA